MRPTPTTTTIAAIATPPGTGGVGILRISGPRAFAILAALAPRLPADVAPHRLRLTRAVDPDDPTGAPLDEVLAARFPAPRSYTGEDVVELHGHGGVLNMRRLLDAACRAGATPAGPGEFTQRAFLNGRLDLTQAEAVADIIHATNDAALKLAQAHLSGALGAAIRDLQESLIVATTLTEAAIDFSTEEHVYQLDTRALIARLDGLIDACTRLLGTFDAGRQTREGVRTVILGLPNAGKSTLFNALCGDNRAIVTDVPGTTRDVLTETVRVRDVTLRLLDTAGLRDTDDTVERIGVQRALDAARDADLVLWVLDASTPRPIDPADASAIAAVEADVLVILNKADLGLQLHPDALEQLAAIAAQPPISAALNAAPTAPDPLLDAIARLARRRLAPPTASAVITRQRHRDALQRTLTALQRAREAASDALSHEFIALDLRLALEALGDILGRVSTDTLLGRIFSEFCVGK